MKSAGCALVLACLAGSSAWGETGTDPAELERTFQAAKVYLPSADGTGFLETNTDALEVGAPEIGEAVRAVVVYAHGCDGFSRVTDTTGRFLARAGFAVLAPNSFARLDKPISCEARTHRGSLHRAVLGWRQAEIIHAIAALRALPFGRDMPFIVMGHSEGAITAATLSEIDVTARILEGWTCHAGWSEYRGLSAPPEQPVLALVGEDDPWFTLPVLRGDCGAFMEQGGPSTSFVYRAPNYLHDKHWLSFDRQVQQHIVSFIDEAIGR